MTSARLSGNQAELLFSALWLQAKMATNWPSSYEAMAHTFSLALLFSRPKVCHCLVVLSPGFLILSFGGFNILTCLCMLEQSVGHNTQLRALQLALSIRNLTFDSTGELCTFISFFVFWNDLGIDKF